MISAKKFREQIDTCQGAGYSNLLKHMEEISKTIMNTEYGNSFLHALSLLDSTHLEYPQWEEFFLKMTHNFYKDKYDKSTYHSMMRVFCSEYGFQYLEMNRGFQPAVTMLLNTMIKVKITLRRRTLSPIIKMAYLQKMPELGMSIYAMSKFYQIKLESVDMAYLLVIGNSIDRITLLQDILHNYTVFSDDAVSVMAENYTAHQFEITEQFTCNGFRIPEFKLDRDDKKSLLLSLRNYVEEKIKHKKATRKKFIQFCDSIPGGKNVVVDATNVARFQQGENSDKALSKPHYLQLQRVVKALTEKGQKVLLCINETHIQKLSAGNKKIMDEIEKMCVVKQTPSGMDDDLCWLFAAISIQNAYLLTTDKLRDHIYAINPKIEKWKEYNRVTFDICRETQEITFNYPRGYEVKPHIGQKTMGCGPVEEFLWIPSDPEKWTEVRIG